MSAGGENAGPAAGGNGRGGAAGPGPGGGAAAGNGNVYVTWPRLLAFLAAMASLSWGISTYQVGAVSQRIDDHKEQPHAQSVRRDELRRVEQRLDEIAKEIAAIHRFLLSEGRGRGGGR